MTLTTARLGIRHAEHERKHGNHVLEGLRELYQSGEMAAWLYGPEALDDLAEFMQRHAYSVTCELIGVEAELNRCRRSTGEYRPKDIPA